MELMKQMRQQAIRDLLDGRAVRTQHELVAALRERGFQATQATVSRDVAELGLVKTTRDGVQAYAIPARVDDLEASGEERLRKLLHDLPIEVRVAGLLLVVRTVPGSAHAVAAALDRGCPTAPVGHRGGGSRRSDVCTGRRPAGRRAGATGRKSVGDRR